MNYTNYQKTKTYQYNSRGNVTKVKEYDYTRGSLGELEGQETFSLGYTDGVWLDEMNLTVDGQSLFSYDDIGNTTQMDFAGLEWENGRQLAEMNVLGYDYAFLTNTYDDEGIRTAKTDGSNNTVYYTTENGKITSQYSINPENGNKQEEMLFLYDGEELIAAEYQNRTYYYVKNAMGDVISILNEEGNSIVDYAYNAWGDIIQKDIHPDYTSAYAATDSQMAQYNAMTYRSYYCDETNGMYYLQSRYYMPSFCRFLNADIPDIAQQSKAEINGLNLFAYCNNDPVNKVDPSGYKCPRFKTMDAAALDFAQRYFLESMYIRMEIFSYIYSFKVNGKICYDYANYIVGTAHEISLLQVATCKVPKNTKIVGRIHTHPNNVSFSPADITTAKNTKQPSYIIRPNGFLQVYKKENNKYRIQTVCSSVLFYVPSATKLKSLREKYKERWDYHIKWIEFRLKRRQEGCEFNCQNLKWPCNIFVRTGKYYQ